MKNMKNYYDILGVSNSASGDDIKRAYRILAHQYHPDKNGGNDKRFKEINEAYRILSDENSRRNYDDNPRQHNPNYKKGEGKNIFNLTPIQTWVAIIVIISTIGIISDSGSGNVNTNDIDIDSSGNSSVTCTENSTWNDVNYKCECNAGYKLDNTLSKCIAKTSIDYCIDSQGPNSSYDSETNSCGCADGYYYGEISKQCTSLIKSRNESCSNEYSNTSFLKYDNDGKTMICDCESGYFWNNEKTGCYSQYQMDQSCRISYGQGSYSTIQNQKNFCDCSYGYSWNIERNTCITTKSIDLMCERDVGRNSHYSGTISDGKYNCTSPY